jgi:hypothetical protein
MFRNKFGYRGLSSHLFGAEACFGNSWIDKASLQTAISGEGNLP